MNSFSKCFPFVQALIGNHIFTSNSAPQPYFVICRLALSAFKVRSLMKCSFTMQRFDADPCDIVVDAQAISLTNRQGYFSHAAWP